MAMDALVKPEALQLAAPVFIVYRGLSTFIVGMWIWGLLLYVWESARVNFIFLFEFDSKSAPNYLDAIRAASSITIIYLVNLLFYVKIARNEIVGIAPNYAIYFPYVLFLYVLLLLWFTKFGGEATANAVGGCILVCKTKLF